MSHRPLIILLVIGIIPLAGCFEATFPIGERGRYGEAYVGYRLPPLYPIISATPLYRDK